MPKFIKWLSDNSVALLIAIVGVCGSFLGAYYGSDVQLQLWKKEKQYNLYRDTIDRRVKIIEAIVKSHVQAQRVLTIVDLIKADTEALAYQLQRCIEDPAGAACAREAKSRPDTMELSKLVAELQSEYYANIILADLYFCDKTRNSLTQMRDSRQYWWQMDEHLRNQFVLAMTSEVTCSVELSPPLR